jgi:glycosyltransferase involved in cell wall biosynthesis
VVVIDSGSVDRTVEIAETGATVIEHPWEGYARQKNFATIRQRAGFFSIDADESLSEA